jgi:hypothetical protein
LIISRLSGLEFVPLVFCPNVKFENKNKLKIIMKCLTVILYCYQRKSIGDVAGFMAVSARLPMLAKGKKFQVSTNAE